MIKYRLKQLLTQIPKLSNNFVARLLIKTNVIEHYQPIGCGQEGKRSSWDRWNVIHSHINEAGLCLDIGCNTGFFASEMAKLGIFTIGLESEYKNIIVANSRYVLPNLVFKHFNLNQETVRQIPPSDIILFLSVFHHIVKINGEQTAVDILKTLASKCQKQLFFETGQPDEIGTKWSQKMQFIGGVEQWIKELFTNECGFQEVKLLGEFETFLTTVKRKLFLAIR